MARTLDPHIGMVHARDDLLPETGPLGRNELKLFPAADQKHRELRLRASKLCDQYNLLAVHDDEPGDRSAILQKLLCLPNDSSERSAIPRIKSPFYADYGVKLNIHPSVFINRNCMILDNPVWQVCIGKDTMVGPNVMISSVSHPVDWRDRDGQRGSSLGGPVSVGKDCFIGANVTILPGVTIGDGCVIGACSVVTRSIPSYHVAVGSPARATHKIDRFVPDAVGLSYADDGVSVLCLKQNHRLKMRPDGSALYVEDPGTQSIVQAVSANLMTILAMLMITIWLCFVTLRLI